MPDPLNVITELARLIETRKRERPADSYTTLLFDGGIDKIGKKVLEEAAELVEAASEGESADTRPEITHEAADLLFHVLVLLTNSGVTLEEVVAELARRQGISGLEEKRRRGGKSGQ